MGRIPGLIKRRLRKKSKSDKLSAVMQLQVAVFLWGFTGVLGRAIELNAYVLVLYRVWMTAGIYYIYLLWRKQSISLPRQGLTKLYTIGILMAFHWVLFYGAIKLATISLAMVCLATASVFTVFVEVIWKRKKIQKLELGLGLLSLFGVVLIYLDNLDFKWGLFIGILAALLSAIFSVMNKEVVEHYDEAVIAYHELFSGAICLLILSPLLLIGGNDIVFIPDAKGWFYLFLLSFFCTFIGQLLALKSLKHLTAFTLSLSVNLETIYGILLAFVFYQEQDLLGTRFWMGAGLIIISVLIQSWVSTLRTQS